MRNIHLTERIRWTWNSLRRGLFNARHLGLTALLTCIGTMFSLLSTELSDVLSATLGDGLNKGLSVVLTDFSTPYTLTDGLSFGLSLGLSFWCLLGLLQGIVQERIEEQDRRVANQGIHRSLRNSVIVGIIGGVTIGSFKVLSALLSIGLNDGLWIGASYPIEELSVGIRDGLDYWSSYWLSIGLPAGICAGLLICIVIGGLATLRHYTLRFLLRRTHMFPWQAPQFLDDATARFLLRRTGGGYLFTHRLLLDYFASLETPSSAEVTTPSVMGDSSPIISRGAQVGTTHREENTSSSASSRKTGFAKEKHISTSFVVVILLLALITSASIFGIVQDRIHYIQKIDDATAQAYNATAAAHVEATNKAVEAIANASPIAYPPTNMSPVLDDPLQDNSKGNNWEVDNSGQGNCKFINQTYDINTKTVEICPAMATNFTNFIYEVQMKIIKGDEGGIAFGISSEDGFYNVVIHRDGSYEICAPASLIFCDRELAQGSSSAIHRGLNQTNLIAVVVHDTIIELYVNHRRIVVVPSKTSTYGWIGVMVAGYEWKETEVTFQNAKVWKL